MGGTVARGISNNYTFAGLVLLGAYLSLNGSNDLADHKGPVITIGGELDGLTRITRIGESFQQYQQIAAEKGSDWALSNIPVVLS